MTFLSVLAILQSNAGIHHQCNEVRLAQTPSRSQGLETSPFSSSPTHGDGFEVHTVVERSFIVDPRGVCQESGGELDDHHPVGEKGWDNA